MNTAEKMETSVHHHVTLLGEAIESKEEFEAAITRLALLMVKKISLRSSDVHRVVTNLRDVEARIVERFTAAHGGQSVSLEVARHNSETFHAGEIDRVLGEL